MNDSAAYQDLQLAAFKAERAASRRLARAEGLSDEEALRRTLAASAGQAGLAVLLAQRAALRARDAERLAARAALHAAARARHQARHDGRPSAWRAWFDGSARPNPGRCGIGALLAGPDGATIEIARDVGHGDSSAAEYQALVAVLEAALAHGATDLAIYGDSRVVIDDVTGPDAFAAPALAAWRTRARTLLARLPHATLRWVPRHKNGRADALSQRALADFTNDGTTAHAAPAAHHLP
ncbi:ribonuclease HI family protein [uncultured Massilia sp.]|uniref:ribonuclease HI family protein n=1 Tax=uncultured Massilia sp. TaxID=169973 RepID=UPI0025E6F293|nr:ribonuclease HI family protein [uncultured Massilia sp.]